MRTLVRKFGRWLARHRQNRYVDKFRRIIFQLHQQIENLNYQFGSNGESWVIKTIASDHDTRMIFDVGANVGNWTKMALREFPGAYVHSFEVVPSTYKQLQEKASGNKAVTLNNLGLSDNKGSIEVFYDEHHHAIATSVPEFSEHFHGYRPIRATLPVLTGDEYCRSKGITHIDFLKIDVEGHEPNVLKGFKDMLAAGAIDIIQFEYGYINIDTKFLLKDFHVFLESFGMKLGKIYPTYVHFREYKHFHEDFFGPNYLAVRADLKGLVKRLSGSH